MAPINTFDKNAGIETIAKQALQIAQSQVGQSEQPKGSNSGPMVDEYLKTVGLSPGFAWCQAFVYWCYNEAAKKLHLPNPMVKTASVHECWDKSATITKLIRQNAQQRPGRIKPGDQFILFFGGNAGHTGIIERVERSAESGMGVLHTIEGNSNNTGGREGYEVVRHQRNLSDKTLQGFIQYS